MSPALLALARVRNLAWPAPHCPPPSHPATRISKLHQRSCSRCLTEAPLGLTRQETPPWSSGGKSPAHILCACANCWAHLCSGALGNQGDGASMGQCHRSLSKAACWATEAMITMHPRTCCFRGCFRNGFVLHEDKN